MSADGRINLYNLNGSVNVLADVVGYYLDHTHDDRYYTKAQVDASVASAVPKVGTVVLAANSVTAGGPDTLAQFSTTVPADGTLIATVEGSTWLDFDAPGAASVVGSGYLALCDATATIAPASCGAPLEVYSQDPDDTAEDANATDPFSITRVIPVTAGNVTLYLNAANVSDGAFGFYGSPTMTVIWMPNTGALPVLEQFP